MLFAHFFINNANIVYLLRKKMMLRIYCEFARKAFNVQIYTKQKYKLL